MPTLKLVYPYPAQGRADLRASAYEEDDEVADVAIRGLRSVAELYSEALVPLALPNRLTEVRVFTTHRPASEEVRGEVFVDPADGFEMSFVHVPTAFANRTPRVRAEMLLDAVHGIVVRLGRDRGWDADLLKTCHRHVLDRDLEYRWTSPPKTSPDRRLVAVADYRMPPEGYGRVRLRLVDRESGDTVATSDEGLAFCSSDGFRRSATSLRWHGKDRVSLVPYDFVPAIRGGEVTLDRVDGAWVSGVSDYMPCLSVPDGDPSLVALPVQVEGRGARAEEQPPEISFVGGGPMEHWTMPFDDAFDDAMRLLTSPAGQQWWASQTVVRTCDVQIYYGGRAPAVRGRLGRGVLRVHVDRPRPDDGTWDSVAAAWRTAEQVVALVRRRTGLPPHPLFTSEA